VQGAGGEAWGGYLGRIRGAGGTEAQQRIFYTALYRAFHMPTAFTDVNGAYRGFDRAVRQAEGTYYTDFSLWDSFRTVHPLYNLIARGEQTDMMRSLLAMAEAGGAFPRWPSGVGYTNCMFGTPADMTIAEAWLKGIDGFDVEASYAILRETATTGPPKGCRFGGRNGLAAYIEHGYCPSDVMNKSVAASLEYAYADHSLSLLARALGKEEDAAMFAERADNYKPLWNPETRYLQPRDSQGTFQKDFKPHLLTYIDFDGKYTDAYVEGSAEQWRWAAPFDPEGLVGLWPDRESFVAALETYFENATPGIGWWNPGPYYWHGNEPYIPAVYLFNAAGRPDLTQKWVRWIMERKYQDNYTGLDGNDDGGTLSSWYVMSSLGFLPIAGTARYEIGSPVFDGAVLELGDGRTLTVRVENNSAEHVYVQRVAINGVELAGATFSHDQIAEGGEIHFVMGPKPRVAGEN